MGTIDRSVRHAHNQHLFLIPARRALSVALSSAIMASLAAGTAVAQESAPSDIEEVTVTGTRIVRSGYEAPTPVSVLGAEALDAMAVTNIADAVNRLPAFAGSVTPRNVSSNVSTGEAGVNNLDLRGLGPSRTLVLLDGKRVVASTILGFSHNGGSVDINAFPNGLIERVEVVTGGASAVYGSDALAGVVNFILDKDYTGFKGSVQAGSTTHGDGENYRASFTAGIPFANDRAHFLFNAEHAFDQGILGKPRDWADTSYQLITNPDYTPTNGQPQLLTVFNAGLATATRGGLIVSCPSAPGTDCPLRGTQFLAGGTPAPFEFGPVISGVVMSGGDWELSRIDKDIGLAIDLRRNTAFTRTSYDISDSTSVYATLHWSRTSADNNRSVPNFNLGNVTVLSGNPFIPASIQAQMTARGIPSFTLGTVNGDMPHLQAENERTFEHYVAGIEGEFGAVGTDWLWDAYVARSTNDITATAPGNRINANYERAIDAVLDAGRIVCRVNADADPANDDSACVPYNPMGLGVNSQAAIDYVTGRGYSETLIEQDVMGVSTSGEPFSSWAGPVSLAFGAEHRRQEVSGSASSLDEASAFFAGNYHASHGKYDVTEAFVETVVPLASGQAFAESLDFNGAARWTDYSTSGEVITWKLGTTWTPIDDVRFRVTRSRDIRAPNLGDLFNAGRTGVVPNFDPVTNMTYVIRSLDHGNPNLDPEKADTTGIGVIFTPSFLPGFGASVDYYSIEIEDAIATLDDQEIINRCFEGAAELCSFIRRDADGFIVDLDVQPANILSQSTSGFDVELSYNFPLSRISSNWDGDLELRALGTYVDTFETVDAQRVLEGAGVNADDMGIGSGSALYAPDLRYLFSATFDNYPLAATLTMRGIGSGVYNNAFIECDPGSCPAATPEHPTINNNHVDAVSYFDLSLSYMFYDDQAEAFFVAQNVLDEEPPLIAGTRGNGWYSGHGSTEFYDRLGRILRAGVRFNF